MDSYLVIKTIHIISATVLFGTGMGIAFFHFAGQRSPDFAAKLFAARATVLADYLFTLTAVIIQPLTGAWLIRQASIGQIIGWCAPMRSMPSPERAGFRWFSSRSGSSACWSSALQGCLLTREPTNACTAGGSPWAGLPLADWSSSSS